MGITRPPTTTSSTNTLHHTSPILVTKPSPSNLLPHMAIAEALPFLWVGKAFPPNSPMICPMNRHPMDIPLYLPWKKLILEVCGKRCVVTARVITRIPHESTIDTTWITCLSTVRSHRGNRNNNRPGYRGRALDSNTSREQKHQWNIISKNASVLEHFRPCPVRISFLSRMKFDSNMSSIFQLAMAIDAVYARNTLQFLCLT